MSSPTPGGSSRRSTTSTTGPTSGPTGGPTAPAETVSVVASTYSDILVDYDSGLDLTGEPEFVDLIGVEVGGRVIF